MNIQSSILFAVFSSLIGWFVHRLYKQLDEQKKKTDDIELNYLDRFMELDNRIHTMEISIIREIQEVKSIMLSMRDSREKEVTGVKQDLALLEREHHIIHGKLIRGNE